MYTLLIVDDEPNILIGMKALIDWESYGITRIETATNCADGLARAVDTRPQIALIDVCVGKDFGQDLVKRIKESGVDCACIMMSGHREFGYACEALRCGAWDYLLKPIQADKLIAAVELIIREKLHGTIHHVSKEEEEDPVLGKKLSELPTLINKLLAMVRVEYRQNITLKSIADRLRMNSTYLGQLFIKETGLKFSEYVMLYRLNTARDHILYTDEKIAVIAEEVGYSNLNYFYTHFRSYFNMTPSEMRLHKSDAVNRKD